MAPAITTKLRQQIKVIMDKKRPRQAPGQQQQQQQQQVTIFKSQLTTRCTIENDRAGF